MKSNFFFLFLLLLINQSYSSCENYTEIFIPKGIPFSFPLEYKFFLTNVTGSAYFTNDTKYNCNSSHQYDWNKLTGISFTPWRHDIDSMMIAWRYIIKTDSFEIGPFYNVDLERIMPLINETVVIKINDPFIFFINYDGVYIKYNDKTVYKPKPVKLKPEFYLSVRVDTWFGGSSLPPSDIYLYLCLVYQ